MGKREVRAFNRHRRIHNLTNNGGVAVRTAHAAGFSKANEEALAMASACETGAFVAFAGGGPSGDPDAYRKAFKKLMEWLEDEQSGPARYLVKFDTSGWRRERTLSTLVAMSALEVLDTQRRVVIKSRSTLSSPKDYARLLSQAKEAMR
jgi:hypothetical protein